MANNQRKKELERLRREVETLQREEESSAEAAQSPMVTEEKSVRRAREDDGETNDLNSQLEELVDVLEQELKDTNPMTLLIIFALGILIGRLLPR